MIYWGVGEMNTKKSSLIALMHPNTIVRNIKNQKQINKGLLLFVIALSIFSKWMDRGCLKFIMFGEIILSILIFVIFLQGIYRGAKGKLSFKQTVNLSLYIHVIVIIANICSGIPIVSVITLIGAQLIGVYLQYLVGMQVVHAETVRLKNICLIELLLVLFCLVVQLLTSWGVYVAYSTKIYHFPLA